MFSFGSTLTDSVVEAEVNAVIHDHQGSFGVAFSVVAGFSVSNQRNGVSFEELLNF